MGPEALQDQRLRICWLSGLPLSSLAASRPWASQHRIHFSCSSDVHVAGPNSSWFEASWVCTEPGLGKASQIGRDC
ncbi:hypothetical protein V8C42DRAFT_324754 [Trichoderma barbatum]